MTRRTPLRAACALAAALTAAGGCVSVKQAESEKILAERRDALEQVRTLSDRNEALQSELAAQRKQIDTLQALGGQKRLDLLFRVERIAMGRHTGGIDTDDKGGQDGIKVFLLPIDADGSVIKAAGDVKIQLFDLAADPAQNLVGEYRWTVEQLSKQWSSGFMAYHFSFECPWPDGPPQHDEITVRVEFTDYLTGKTFTAQELCKVKLHAAK